MLNTLAPLWDKVQLLDSVQRRSSHSSLLQWAGKSIHESFFGKIQVKINSSEALATMPALLTRQPIIGLSNIELDHYNRGADPSKWKSFRQWLLRGFHLREPKRNSSHIHITFLQRKYNRRFLRL